MKHSSGAGLVLAVLLASCGGTRPPAPRPRGERCPSPPAAVSVAEPVAVSVAEPVAPPPHATPPATGALWARRIARAGGVLGSIARPGEAPTTERWGSTRCARVTIDERSLAIELEQPRATVHLRRARDGTPWVHPTLTLASRSVTLEGRCEAEWVAPQLFEDHAACAAAPDAYRERCGPSGCEWDDAGARPLVLAGCEDALASLASLGSRIESASHDASRRTLDALERTVARGGHVYEREGDACARVEVGRSREGEVLLTTVRRDAALETTTVGRYLLEPLFGRATLVATTSESRALDGGPGGRGASGGPVAVTLALGDGVVALGHRTLFLRERDCAAAGEPP